MRNQAVNFKWHYGQILALMLSPCYRTVFREWRDVKMNAQLVKPKTILNGSLLIALYFTFWIVVTVVLPIISLGLRLYTKERGILNNTQEKPET